MPFRWSATDPDATDIGPVYDIGLATRDGSTLACLDRNRKVQPISSCAFMVSRDAQKSPWKEATELQEKSQLVQLGTSTAIDREFDQWVQNTQGDWSGGIGQRVYGQQGVDNAYFDGEGLLWPLNDYVPQIALRGPTQPLPSAGITGPSAADQGQETINPGSQTVQQVCAAIASFKATGVVARVGALGAFLQGSNTAVAPAFGQATTAGHALRAWVSGQRQQKSGNANIGDQAGTTTFDFSGANLDNIVGTNDTFTVPAGGIFLISITCDMGGHTGAVTTEFVVWNASSGAVLAVTAATSVGAGHALRTLNLASPVFVAAGTVIRIGFWRNAAQDAEWGVTGSGSFLTATNASAATMPGTACGAPYSCGNPEMYATYYQLLQADIVQSNAGAAPGWSKILQVNSPDGYQQAQLWGKDNCGAGETAPAFSAAQGARPMAAQLGEWSNIATASSLDQSGTGTQGTGNSYTVQTGAIDAVAGDLVMWIDVWSLGAASTVGFTDSMNNGITVVHAGDTSASSLATHSSFNYGIVPTGVAQWAQWAISGTAGGYVEGLGHGYAVCYLDNQTPTPHWHVAFFSGDQAYDVDIGVNTGGQQGPLHMHVAAGYLWVLYSSYPNTTSLKVLMLGCPYGSNVFQQLRSDALGPAIGGGSGFFGLIAASYVAGKLYVGVLQADQNVQPGTPNSNRNALYVIDYSAGTGTVPTGITTPIFQFPFERGFKLVDLVWQGNQLIVSVGDGFDAYIYQLSAPFTSISTQAVIVGIANALLCSVGSTLFIVGWTPGPSGVNRMDLYTLNGGTLTQVPFTPTAPFLDAITSPVSYGGYAFWAIGYPTPGGPAGQKTATVYAYDVVRSRLFRAITFTTAGWIGPDIFGHDEIGVYGVTTRTLISGGGVTFQSQIGIALFSGILSNGLETAREFYWGVQPITPAPSFSGLLQMGVDIISGIFDFTAATNKLFREKISHFIGGLIPGSSLTQVRLNAWFDQDPQTLNAVPDFTSNTGQAPNPLPGQLDLDLFENRVARKTVYEVISSGGGYDAFSNAWRNAPKIVDVIVAASAGWVIDAVLNLAEKVLTNTGQQGDYAYAKQSDPNTNVTIDQVVAYNFLRQLWRQKGGKCIVYLPNGDTYNALIQVEQFEGPKPYAVSARGDVQTQWREQVTVKIREDI